MKKIFTILSTLLLGTAASQATVTVSYLGENVPDGGVVTITAKEYKFTEIPAINYVMWEGEALLTVTSATPTQVKLEGTNQDIQFCPMGVGCLDLTPSGDVFTGSGEITTSPVECPTHLNYPANELPVGVETLKITFTDADSTFSCSVVFDTTDSGVDNVGINAEGPAKYYTLQGAEVENPVNGLYVKVEGGKASKVLVK